MFNKILMGAFARVARVSLAGHRFLLIDEVLAINSIGVSVIDLALLWVLAMDKFLIFARTKAIVVDVSLFWI